MDYVDAVMSPQFLATLFSAIAVFATMLVIVMPLLEGDRTAQRMKTMAIERDKMRSQRIAEMAAKDRHSTTKLRQAPKGYMQQIVDKLDLRWPD